MPYACLTNQIVTLTKFKEVTMKKHTLTLSVVLLTVLGSFQDAQAMGGARRFAQGLFSKAQAVRSTHFKDVTGEDVAVVAGLAATIGGSYMLFKTIDGLGALLDTFADSLNTMPPSSVEPVLELLDAIEKDGQKETPSNLRPQIETMYAQENFGSFVHFNAKGFPLIEVKSIRDDLSCFPVLKEVMEKGSTTVSTPTSSFTVNEGHVNDVLLAYVTAAKNYLTSVRDASDALEVKVQKQVLGLEGVTK
jgi:hypothetical protein